MPASSFAPTPPSAEPVTLKSRDSVPASEGSTLRWRASSNGGLVRLRDSARPRALPPTRVDSGSDEPGAPGAALLQGAPLQPADFIGGVYRIGEKPGGGAVGQGVSAFGGVLAR